MTSYRIQDNIIEYYIICSSTDEQDILRKIVKYNNSYFRFKLNKEIMLIDGDGIYYMCFNDIKGIAWLDIEISNLRNFLK